MHLVRWFIGDGPEIPTAGFWLHVQLLRQQNLLRRFREGCKHWPDVAGTDLCRMYVAILRWPQATPCLTREVDASSCFCDVLCRTSRKANKCCIVQQHTQEPHTDVHWLLRLPGLVCSHHVSTFEAWNRGDAFQYDVTCLIETMCKQTTRTPGSFKNRADPESRSWPPGRFSALELVEKRISCVSCAFTKSSFYTL